MKLISFYNRINHINSRETIPLDIFLENIRSGVWEDVVNKVRLIADKKERAKYKADNVESVTISGAFSVREDDKISDHSGYIGIDIDEDDLPERLTLEETKEILFPDKYIYAGFTSVSGRGLCLLFKINPDKHREAFQGISEYLYTHYRVTVDPTSINPSRARFVSFDPHTYIADHAVPKFAEYPKIKEKKKFDEVIYTGSDFSEILNQITTSQVNITQDSYFVWLRLAFALVHKFGEAGRQYFHLISQYSSKYDYAGTDKQYNNCLRHKASSRIITITSFYFYAKQAGIKIYSERTKMIAYAASQGKKSGLNAKQITANLDKFEGINGEDVQEIVDQAILHSIKIDDDTIIDQVEMYIRQNYSLRRNEVTRYIENHGNILLQVDINSIYIKIKKLYSKVPYEIIDRLINSDFVPSYNPFAEFFQKNGGYNGQDYKYKKPAIDTSDTSDPIAANPDLLNHGHDPVLNHGHDPVLNHGHDPVLSVFDLNFIGENSNLLPTYTPALTPALASTSLVPANVTGITALLGSLPDVPVPGTPEFAAMYPMITAFFGTLKGTDPLFTLYFGTKWLVGSISAVHGQHSPLFFVLCGGKNKGKTQWFRRMMPTGMKKYYAESKLDEGKDDDILMCQKWFIMDDEMSGKSKREAIKINNLTSKQVFSLREPYGKNNVDLLRLAVLCGTTNHPEILTDPGNNRRFIPVHIDDIDFAGYNRIDKTELFMEAYRLYKSGFHWELDSKDIAWLERDTEEFVASSAEAELIQKYFQPGQPGTSQELTATDIKVILEKHSQQKLTLNRIGLELKHIGYKQLIKKVNGSSRRVYFIDFVNILSGLTPPSFGGHNVPF